MFSSRSHGNPSSPSRPPAVAGMFYPADPGELRQQVERLLAEARPPLDDGPAPRALILPHAGYVYSGGVTATGYALLGGPPPDGPASSGAFARAVVIGPAHRVPVRGVADAGVDAFETPLGTVATPAGLLDTLRERLSGTFPELLVTSPRVHAHEHSVEVHLPFLQVLAPELPVLPLVAGDATVEEMTELVAAVMADEDTLLIISSDLSHFLTQDEAVAVDSGTLDRIVALEAPLPPRSACGAIPINGLLGFARRAGWAATVVDRATSADVPHGDPHRVVGYPAVRFDPIGSRLPAYARAVLEHRLAGGPDPADPDGGFCDLVGHPWLMDDGASFVTLTVDGRLRGCIGSLEATRPLGADIAAHAVDAALHDPRFPAVTADELPGIRVEVSVLSAPEPLDASSEADAIAALRPHVDGAILSGSPTRDGAGAALDRFRMRLDPAPARRRGTFLPQVWEQLPDPTEFVRHLKAKAGLAADAGSTGWGDDWRLSGYTVQSWEEGEGR
ncbi:MAG: AmmeMemoRadiSam system protein B [Corynebacterium sp.]|nr:AmmeMemoRadiSam system protein B [Corynebacterium sp.]